MWYNKEKMFEGNVRSMETEKPSVNKSEINLKSDLRIYNLIGWSIAVVGVFFGFITPQFSPESSVIIIALGFIIIGIGRITALLQKLPTRE